MSTTLGKSAITVALVGNPNTGKSTLFCALAGIHQRVANYPGVTVEKRLGSTRYDGHRMTLIDLPGTYSLAPRSLDERVAVDVCLGRQADVPAPDVIVCIADASNLERHLYLVSQVLELGCPVVVALNMIDVARDREIEVDVERLQERLGVSVIATVAHRSGGLDGLQAAIVAAYQSGPVHHDSPLPQEFQQAIRRLRRQWSDEDRVELPEYLVGRLVLEPGSYLMRSGAATDVANRDAQVEVVRGQLRSKGLSLTDLETSARYDWVDSTLRGIVKRPAVSETSWTDRIDRLLTHPIAGTVLFLVVTLVVFQSIFSWSAPLQGGIEQATTWMGTHLIAWMPAGVLRSLLADGVIAGVGAVLAFVPQIATLFLFIAVLEDCGYMSRAAYLMDGLMAKVGLSGKSFIPLVSSFACAVPGIMATRVIEDRRDRLVTILVAPLMSCSARLPVYTLLIAAFIPRSYYLGGWIGLPGITLFSLYLLGILVAVAMARLLKRTVLRGETPSFVMELPDYRLPSIRVVISRVWEQSWAFVRSAGTLILAVTVLIWAAAYFPHPEELESQVRLGFADREAALASQLESADEVGRAEIDGRREQLRREIDHQVAGAYMQQSWLGRTGRLIAPLVRPLGWDWRIGCAVIASFPAREVVIGSMGVIYNLGEGQDESSVSLQQKLRRATWPENGRPVFTIPVALSIMVFYSLCAQCAATLFVIRRETASRWWPLFTFAYMTSLAYLGAWATHAVGTWIASS